MKECNLIHVVETLWSNCLILCRVYFFTNHADSFKANIKSVVLL